MGWGPDGLFPMYFQNLLTIQENRKAQPLR